jgi:hypothetical protein
MSFSLPSNHQAGCLLRIKDGLFGLLQRQSIDKNAVKNNAVKNNDFKSFDD